MPPHRSYDDDLDGLGRRSSSKRASNRHRSGDVSPTRSLGASTSYASIELQASMKTDVPRVAFIMLFLLILVGPITGPQQLFPAVGERGVFSDKCAGAKAAAMRNYTGTIEEIERAASTSPVFRGQNTTLFFAALLSLEDRVEITLPCKAQEEEIEWAADLFLSISNFLCVVNGVLVDLLGAYRMAIAGTFVWVAAKSLAGIAPESGVAWTVCQSISTVVGLGSFLAVSLVHMKKACPDPKKYAFWCFLGSAFWDIAVMFNIPLSYFYRWRALSLAGAYAIYGTCVGVPFLLGMIFLFRQHAERDDDDEDDGEDEDSTGTGRHSVDSVENTGAIDKNDNSNSKDANTAAAATRGRRRQSPPSSPYMRRKLSIQDDIAVHSEGDDDSFDDDADGVTTARRKKRRDGEDAASSGDDHHQHERSALLSARRGSRRSSGARNSRANAKISNAAAAAIITVIDPNAVRGPQSQHDERDSLRASRISNCRSSATLAETAIPESVVDTAEGLRGKARVLHVLRAAKGIVASPIYWVFVAHASMTVTIGYYLIANVSTVATYLGTTSDEANETRLITTFMMSGIGLLNAVPGKVLQVLGTRRGLVLCLVTEVLWLIGVAVCFSLRDGVAPLYAGFSAMLIWRVWGFGLSTPFLSWRFYKQRSSIGFAYGLAYTVAGAVSALWGNFAHNLVDDDAERWFFPLVVGTIIATAVMQLIFAICVAKVTDADPTEELQHAALEAALKAEKEEADAIAAEQARYLREQAAEHAAAEHAAASQKKAPRVKSDEDESYASINSVKS